MAYQNAQRIPLSEKYPIFSGGYVDNVFDIDMGENQSPYLRNCRLDGASIRSRKGYLTFKELDGVYPRGIATYLRADPANNVLLVRHNQDTDKKLITLKKDGTLVEIDTSTDIASNNRMNFVNVGDVMYCMNGSDEYGKLSGTTYTIPNVGIVAFKPRFGVMFNSSMFVAGWTANPNKVYKSVGDNYDDFAGAGSDKFTFVEQITGLSATTQGLFYFTKNSISATGMSDVQDTAGTISYITRVMNAKEGAVNHESIVSVGMNVYYVTPNNKICQLMRGQSDNGFEMMELSHRSNDGISKFMESLDPDQEDSFGYYLPKENIIKRHFKSLGATFNDTIVVYDILKNAFLIDTNQYFYDATVFDGDYYAISMLEPKVFQDEYGYTDDDTPIPFEYRTKWYNITDPTIKNIIRESRSLVAINELAECEQSIWTDKGQIDTKVLDSSLMKSISSGGIGTTPIGTESIGEEGEKSEGFEDDMEDIDVLRTKGNLNEIFKKIQWRWINNSLAGKVILKSLSAKIEVKPELATNLTE